MSYPFRPVQITAIATPAGDSQVGIIACISEPAVVGWADGVFCSLQIGRVGGAKGEQVDHFQAMKAPGFGETDAATNGGIVAAMICRRRVQADE